MVTLICLLIKADVGSYEKILVRLRLCLSYNDENTKQPQITLYILSSLFDKNLNIQNQNYVFICVPHKLLLLLQLHQHPIAVLGVEEHDGLAMGNGHLFSAQVTGSGFSCSLHQQQQSCFWKETSNWRLFSQRM